MSVLTWIENHPGLAAWVQALGTIAAVAFAVWMPTRARRQAEKVAEIAVRAPITSAMVAATEAFKYVRGGNPSLQDKQKIAQKLDDAHKGLNEFAIHTLSARGAVAFQEFRHAFHMLVAGFNDPLMRALGNMRLRKDFLEYLRAMLVHVPGAVSEELKPGLSRAIEIVNEDIAKREQRGEKADDHA